MPASARLLKSLRFVLLLLCVVNLRGDSLRSVRSLAADAAFPASLPRTVLWAWEEPEDLRGIDPAKIGVAYLAESLRLSTTVTVLPRYQPLWLKTGTPVMAVVRIEPGRGFVDSPALRVATADALAVAARQPGIRAFQVDFDAARSQREFYRAVLQRLRAEMPAQMPLSITALLSWCAGDDWIAGLPIEEAVPMYFRLGVRRPLSAAKDGWRIHEPLCGTSVGVSTDESWPAVSPGQRVYLFAPRPWTALQLATISGTPASSPKEEMMP